MQKSETIASLAKALLKAQSEMGAVKKTATNPQFRSKYANLSDICEVALPTLNDNGLSVIQLSVPDADNVIVETVLLHESGEWLSGQISIPLVKRDAQAVGSAPLCKCNQPARFWQSDDKAKSGYFCAKRKDDPANCGFKQWSS